MKRYKIIHRTDYGYSDWVELLPHLLRLRPREGHDLRIESSVLDIDPPAILRWHLDAEGNTIATASFNTPTQHLCIESEIIVEQYNEEPLDFLITDHAVHFPFDYHEEERRLLSIYMDNTIRMESSHGPLKQWKDLLFPLTHECENIQTFSLLSNLSHTIHQKINYQRRDDEGVQSPEQTLALATGSCRDMAYLFISTARTLGFAARFVSGYMHSGASGVLYGATHAWAEVFIPGAGWKGFDPTNDSIVGSEYIAVSVAHSLESIPPVSGQYQGTPSSTMRVVVMVKELSPCSQAKN